MKHTFERRNCLFNQYTCVITRHTVEIKYDNSDTFALNAAYRERSLENFIISNFQNKTVQYIGDL